MRKFAGIAVAVAFGLAMSPGWADARMNDEQCAEHVAQECGPIPFERCFDDASMWDKIAPECTSYVQTNLENAREAEQ